MELCNPAVIALSPGGVHVGFEVARALGGQLDLVAIPGDGPGIRSAHISSLDILQRAAVIVDDGRAPLATVLATVAALRREGAVPVVLAVPALSGNAIPTLEDSCDEVVYLVRMSSGDRLEDQYHEFRKVSRNEVSHFLHDARDPHSPPAPPVDDAIDPPGTVEAI
jgi:predicted phosphoribosyltransferase